VKLLVDMNLPPPRAAALAQGELLTIDLQRTRLRLLPLPKAR